MEDGWPGCMPFARQIHAPLSVSMMARGRTHHCTQCGTSAHAARQLNGRSTPAYRSPERLADDLYDAHRHRDGAAYVAGEIREMVKGIGIEQCEVKNKFPFLLSLLIRK